MPTQMKSRLDTLLNKHSMKHDIINKYSITHKDHVSKRTLQYQIRDKPICVHTQARKELMTDVMDDISYFEESRLNNKSPFLRPQPRASSQFNSNFNTSKTGLKGIRHGHSPLAGYSTVFDKKIMSNATSNASLMKTLNDQVFKDTQHKRVITTRMSDYETMKDELKSKR